MEPKSRINRAFLPCYGIKQTLLVKVSRGGCWRDTSGNTIEFLDQSKTIHRRIRKHQVIKLFNWSPWYNIDVGLVTNVKGFYLLFSCFYRFVIYFLFFLFYIYFYFEDGIVKLSFFSFLFCNFVFITPISEKKSIDINMWQQFRFSFSHVPYLLP